MILLTGATGTIGKATVTALQAAGQPFRVAVRSAAKPVSPAAETVAFDWDDLNSYLPVMQGIDKLFLLTPNSERQVGYVLQAIAAAKRAGVKYIVRLSVAGANADPGFILGRQHFAAEREIRTSGIAWTILRPTFFMQNFLSYYGVDPRADSQVYLPNGQGRAAWIDGADVGEMAARLLTTEGNEGKVFELTGPEALSTQEALAILSQELGHNYTYVDVPEDAARHSMEAGGMPLWQTDAFLELHAIVREGHAEKVSGDVRAILGREPHTLREWAKRLKSMPQ